MEGALFLARDQRPGHVAVFCSISGAFDASPVLVLLTNEEVLDPLTELAREWSNRLYLCSKTAMRGARQGEDKKLPSTFHKPPRGSAGCGRLASGE